MSVTEEVESIQGLLWKYKKGTIGGTWKKNWVYADNQYFLQWPGKVRPVRNERPKYTLKMVHCKVVTKSSLKRFAFEIIDNVQKTSMIFAADDSHSYSKWIKVLSQKAVQTTLADLRPEDLDNGSIITKSYLDDDQSSYSGSSYTQGTARGGTGTGAGGVNRMPTIGEDKLLSPSRGSVTSASGRMEEEKIMKLFHQVSQKNHHGCRYVHWSQLKNILEAFDQRLNVERVFTVLKQYDPSLSKDARITREEFRRIWHENELFINPQSALDMGADEMALMINHLGPSLPAAVTATQQQQSSSMVAQQNLEWSAFFLGEEQHLQPYLSALMLRINVPTALLNHMDACLPPNISLSPVSPGGQHQPSRKGSKSVMINTGIALASSSMTGAMYYQKLNEYSDKLDTLCLRLGHATHITSANSQDDLSTVAEISKTLNEEMISTAFALASVYGTFRANALKGTKTLIDELCMPQSMKTLTPVSLEGEHVVYEYEGVCLRLLTTSIEEQDAEMPVERERACIAKDDVTHKMANNQYKGYHYLNSMADNFVTNHHLAKKYLDIDLSSSTNLHTQTTSGSHDDDGDDNHSSPNNHQPFSSSSRKSSSLLEYCQQFKLRTKLFSIIDYAGFRVLAYVPHSNLTKTVNSPLANVVPEEEQNEIDGETKEDGASQGENQFFQALEGHIHLHGVREIVKKVMWNESGNPSPSRGLTPNLHPVSVGGGGGGGGAGSVNSHSQPSSFSPSRSQSSFSPTRHHFQSQAQAQALADNKKSSSSEPFYGFLQANLVLPADLPRAATHDVLSKALRPEFVAIHQRFYGNDQMLLSAETLMQMCREDANQEEIHKKLTGTIGERAGVTANNNNAASNVVQSQKAKKSSTKRSNVSMNDIDEDDEETDDEDDDDETTLQQSRAQQSRGAQSRSQANAADDDDDDEGHDTEHHGKKQVDGRFTHTADAYNHQREQWLSAINYFYQEHLPEFVAQLDSFAFTPYDSHSLTSLMHDFGINIRQLGSIYALSRNHVVKCLIMNEIISRSVKYLVKHITKSYQRKCKGLSLQAEERKRSKQQDYEELMNEVIEIERKKILLNMFNFLFPCLNPLPTSGTVGANGLPSDGNDDDLFLTSLHPSTTANTGTGNLPSATAAAGIATRADFEIVLCDIIYRKFGLFVQNQSNGKDNHATNKQQHEKDKKKHHKHDNKDKDANNGVQGTNANGNGANANGSNANGSNTTSATGTTASAMSGRLFESYPIHPPQLFLALQYHLQIRFKDNIINNISHDTLTSTNIFTTIDVIDFFVTKMKYSSTSSCGISSTGCCNIASYSLFHGEFQAMLDCKYRFLSLGFTAEAVALSEFQYLLMNNVILSNSLTQSYALSLSWQEMYDITDITYTYALALYLHKQYDRCCHVIRQYLHNPQLLTVYSAAGGRILTLLMASEYCIGRYDYALQAYDTAIDLLQRYLPLGHPLITLPMIVLSDLYLTHYHHHTRDSSHSNSHSNTSDKDVMSNDKQQQHHDLYGLQQSKVLLEMAIAIWNENLSMNVISSSNTVYDDSGGWGNTGVTNPTTTVDDYTTGGGYSLAARSALYTEATSAATGLGGNGNRSGFITTTYTGCSLVLKLTSICLECHEYDKVITLLTPVVVYLEDLVKKASSSSSITIKTDLALALYRLSWAHYHYLDNSDDPQASPIGSPTHSRRGRGGTYDDNDECKSDAGQRIEEEHHGFAIQYGQRCLVIMRELQPTSLGGEEPNNTPKEGDGDNNEQTFQLPLQPKNIDRDKVTISLIISMELILYDIFSIRNEYDFALDMLTMTWNSLKIAFVIYRKHIKSSNILVIILGQVALKSVELAFSSLPMPSRSLLESVSNDWKNDLDNAHIQDQKRLPDFQKQWYSATNILIDVMWKGEIVSYIGQLILEIQRRVAEGDSADFSVKGSIQDDDQSYGDNRRSPGSAIDQNRARVEMRNLVSSLPPHVQAAAIYTLVQNPLEFANLMVTEKPEE